jgi:hydroxymethylglutaryl-CoA lyase
MSMLGSLPKNVSVYEVGPRDGLQNEARIVPLEGKLALIAALADAGLKRIEAGSFVSPKWIPALADSDQVFQNLPRRPGVTYSALVPNQKGLERAIAARASEVAVFLSASETHSRKNINKTIAEALAGYREVIAAARQAGLPVRGYLSVVWGCPYEGAVPVERVVTITRELLDMGVAQVSLGDTIGVGSPRQTEEILGQLLRGTKPDLLAVHFHDTRGLALANVLVSLTHGITTVDASVGGLGGCPYAPGAAGNLATEDLVNLLDGLGIACGVDLMKLVAAGELAQQLVGRPLPGKMLAAAIGERQRRADKAWKDAGGLG